MNAHTGELIRFRDSNAYGHIQGGVYKTDAPQNEVVMPFPKADYGTSSYADTSGNFVGIAGTSAMNGLNTGAVGVSGGVKITDNCGPISLGANGVGFIDFGGGAGTDCTTPGVGGAGNTHAARTQYWNVAQIKMKGITYLPTNTWVQGQLTDLVNLTGTCNALWDHVKLKFYQTFGGCANTGELPGVCLHEWGHGMDENDGSGLSANGPDNKPIESRADWTASLQTHQSCAGAGLLPSNCGGYGNPCTSCTGVREADYAMHSPPTPWTPQNKGTLWAPGTQCASGSYSRPLRVGRSLRVRHRHPGAVGLREPGPRGRANQFAPRHRMAARGPAVHTGMPVSKNMYTCTGTTTKVSNGCGAGSLYTVMRAIDDDGDGVANGTPHAAAIFAALNRHGIACGASSDATNQNQTSCPSLTTPTPTATANGHQITLSWTTGGGSATRYLVFRNETSCNAGFTQVATVNAPTLTYTDTAVAQGLTYYYRIQSAGGERFLRQPHEQLHHRRRPTAS